MKIDDEDWEVFMHHSAAMLAHLGVSEPEAGEVLAFFSSLRDDIVNHE
jgi:hypothetical protein